MPLRVTQSSEYPLFPFSLFSLVLFTRKKNWKRKKSSHTRKERAREQKRHTLFSLSILHAHSVYLSLSLSHAARYTRSTRVVNRERERERQRRELEGFKSKMASGDDTARAVTTTLTTSSEPEVDRSVHPSGIVPTLQCVLFITSL